MIALPYLVLLKVRASEGIATGKLARMLGATDEADLDRTRQVIRTHLSDAEADLESLIYLGPLGYAGTHGSHYWTSCVSRLPQSPSPDGPVYARLHRWAGPSGLQRKPLI